MTTPHPDFSLYFSTLHTLMRELGHHPLCAKRIAQDVRKMGKVPCPKCSTKLALDKVNRKWVVTCGECLRTTDSYTTELRALKATRQWLQEEA